MRRNLFLFLCLIGTLSAKAGGLFPTDPFDKYLIPKDKCKTIRHHTGSIIFVPAKAFQREDGSALRGDVTLKYREIRTPSEMIAADIPMTYTENGRLYQLQSSGMFEIEAEENGQAVKLAPGKKIQVRFAAPNDLERLEAFFLDPKTRSWQKETAPVADFSYNTANANPEGGRILAEELGDDNEWVETEYETVQMQGVLKAMNIEKMGLYNYDQIYHAPNSVTLKPDFRLPDGSPVKTMVYVVYDSLNMVIYYTPDDFAEQFALLLRDDIRMFTILPDKRVATLAKGAFRKEEIKKAEGKSFPFRMELQPGAARTREELAAAVGIR